MTVAFDMRRTDGNGRFAVAFLAFAILVVCATGPMMILADPCETLLTAAVPCSNSASASHAVADQVALAVPPAVDVTGIGLPDPVALQSPTGLTAIVPQSAFISIPLRA